jgi:hypothetical protein
MARNCSECRKDGHVDLAERTAVVKGTNPTTNWRLRICQHHMDMATQAGSIIEIVSGTQWDGNLWASESGKTHLNPVHRVRVATENTSITKIPTAPLKQYKLVHTQTGDELPSGISIKTVIGTTHQLTGWAPPQIAGDPGRVWLKTSRHEDMEHIPSFIGAEFVEVGICQD